MSNGKSENYLRPVKPAGKPFRGRNKPARKKPRKVSKAHAKRLKTYVMLCKQLKLERPICQCWLAENGWEPAMGLSGPCYFKPWLSRQAFNACEMVKLFGALPSESCHHTKGRGKYFLAYETFMAVSNQWHRWIEDHKDQAIEKGWLSPDKNRRPIVLPKR